MKQKVKKHIWKQGKAVADPYAKRLNVVDTCTRVGCGATRYKHFRMDSLGAATIDRLEKDGITYYYSRGLNIPCDGE